MTEALSGGSLSVMAGLFSSGDVDAALAAAGQGRRSANVPRPAGLTEREVDVRRLIARAGSNQQAARQLGISPKTVGNHVEHIYAKANVRTRAGAMRPSHLSAVAGKILEVQSRSAYSRSTGAPRRTAPWSQRGVRGVDVGHTRTERRA
jgi:DNA-binding CsgD family transcriptional regulator